jgi:hypothetical protein
MLRVISIETQLEGLLHADVALVNYASIGRPLTSVPVCLLDC